MLPLAAYGTLMTGQENRLPPAMRARFESLGPCRIPGVIHAIGPRRAYPGLTATERRGGRGVRGELLNLGADLAAARALLDLLDRYEGYDPAAPDRSPYRRERVLLLEPRVIAWVYVWAGDPASRGGVPIPSGDWRDFAAAIRR